ncbi:amidohydrolase family protein [Novosphingobium aquae]|uniref:Amidohydrolase family protein n=1 Tax=Novosphingobium aquae TaxID=3133435 RepID=A0ABU8SBR0_9SPHN
MMKRVRAAAVFATAALLTLPVPATAQRAAAAPWQENPYPSTYRAPTPEDQLLRGATILDGAGKRIDGGDVLVRAGKIVAVGKGLVNPGVREVDARGRWVTPGVIDVHSHDGTFVRPLSDPDREASDVSDLSSANVADTWIETAVNSQDTSFDRALSNGVTTMQILPGSTPIFAGRSVVVKPIRASTVWGMKVTGNTQGFKMACGENPKSWGAESENDGPTSRQGVIAYMRQGFINARAYKLSLEKARLGTGEAPPRDLKLETLAGILAGDIRVHLHCYRANDIAGALALAKEFGFRIAAIHHATEAYKIPALMREAGTCAAVWADWWGFKMEAQDAIRAEAPMLERAGVCVMMHSDSPADGQRLNIAAAKAAGAGRRIGIDIPPEQMIRWITSNPARLLGLDKHVGILAPGYEADLVLWSASPFSIYAEPDLVMIGGAVAWDRTKPRGEPVSDFELGRKGAK